MNFYSNESRLYQDHFGTRPLADRFEGTIVRDALTEEDHTFIESRDFFLLATVDAEGWPQCSYKGGAPGLVKVLDAKTFAFPNYDGNGMYLSMGNISATGRLAFLFIDLEDPRRLRVQGQASIDPRDPLLAHWHGAELVVRVTVARVWPNCPRYIHRHQRVEHSPYVPLRGTETPVPAWKRMEFVQDVLPERDRVGLDGDAPQ